jgi:hypothetical protein
MTISITVDAKDVLNTLALFPETLREQVVALSVNKTLDKARTEMKRQITAVYELSSSEVLGALNVSKVSRKNNKFTAELYPSTLGGRGRAMNVIHFVRGTSRGELLFKFKKAGGNKVISKTGKQSAPFVGNTGRTVFRRLIGVPSVKNPRKEAIEPVQVIDVPQMFNTKVINQAVLDKAADDLVIEAGRALDLMLSKMGASRG